MKKKRRVEFEATVKRQIRAYYGYIRSQKRLLAYLKYIPNLDEFPGTLSTFADDQYHFRTPWDNPAMEKIKAKMLDAGWICMSDEPNIDCAWRRMAFYKTVKNLDKRYTKNIDWELKFYVFGKIDMDGATCKRVKIGENEVLAKENIYEIVCEEGAAEMEVVNAEKT